MPSDEPSTKGVFPEVDFREHELAGYPPRTRHNATCADLTAAFAMDFASAGERLTKKAAGARYVAIHLNTPPIEASRALYRALKAHKAHVLNIAGNGIHTLAHHGMSQDDLNLYLFKVLAKVAKHWRIDRVISGGQLGVDMAGVIAASTLSIPSIATLPKGFVQRDETGRDFEAKPEDLQREVRRWQDIIAQALQAIEERTT